MANGAGIQPCPRGLFSCCIRQRLATMALAGVRAVIGAVLIGGLIILAPWERESRTWAADSADISISTAVVGGFPQIRDMSLGGRSVSREHVDNGVGAAVKVSLFPQWTQRALGIELEYFGTTGKVSAVTMANGSGKASLTVLNSMVNLVLKQPTGLFRPYAGVGIGYSGGILYRADFPDRANREFESTPGLSYQFMGGLQWQVGARAYLFAEYKHLVTAFHWKAVSFDYRGNYALLGVGWTF
ncbi:MAG: outer membrane beta-barrel protein [Nitrospira sp.]|nr:outer membrane beta-barrel protein [Nitrospira sp.]